MVQLTKEYKSKKNIEEIVVVLNTLKDSTIPYISIPQIHSVEDYKVTYRFEEIKGTRLSDILREEGKIVPNKAIKYCTQILSALCSLHSKRILHLDIKPSNILIDENDNAILIDFDNSRLFTTNEVKQLMGHSFPYAPADIWNDACTFNPDIDNHMLLAVFYEMITGEKPPYCIPNEDFYSI